VESSKRTQRTVCTAGFEEWSTGPTGVDGGRTSYCDPGAAAVMPWVRFVGCDDAPLPLAYRRDESRSPGAGGVQQCRACSVLTGARSFARIRLSASTEAHVVHFQNLGASTIVAFSTQEAWARGT
jgi:hypothetical protein